MEDDHLLPLPVSHRIRTVIEPIDWASSILGRARLSWRKQMTACVLPTYCAIRWAMHFFNWVTSAPTSPCHLQLTLLMGLVPAAPTCGREALQAPLDLSRDHLDRDRVVSPAQHDHTSATLARLNELIIHRLNRREMVFYVPRRCPLRVAVASES